MTQNRHNYRTNKNAVFTPLDEDKATILDLVSKRYFTLNATGIRIWQLVEEGRSPAEIADHLYQEYEIDRADAEEKTVAFLNDLIKNGLITTR